MNIYVACAEHDKSCPYADAWQLVAYSLFVRNMMNHAPMAGAWLLIACIWVVRNMINHAPTAHALPYSTYPFFANFTYTTCNFQRKCLYLRRNLI